MRITTKGRYSIRMMLELARNYNKKLLLLKDISNTEKISYKYLAQLVNPLKVAGLIKSRRGVAGGFSLARPPEEISLAEIIKSVEGSLYPVFCVDNPEMCKRSNICTAHDLWNEIGKKINNIFDSYSLSDILNIDREKNKK